MAARRPYGFGANYADCCVVLHGGQRTAGATLARRLVLDTGVTWRGLRVVDSDSDGGTEGDEEELAP